MRKETPAAEVLSGIVRTLHYFDIFLYPLTVDEIHRYLPVASVSRDQLLLSLDQLVQSQSLFRFDNVYALHNNPDLARRRAEGNRKAQEYMVIAGRMARRISRFPFVRSVMVSGSLSKGYADATSDIDFFIVTSPGRLWIARTLLVLYKRLFLFNSHKYFCVNYFVDSNHLTIEDRNIFTATEVATLIPLTGVPYYHQLVEQNTWIKSYFPHFEKRWAKEPETKREGNFWESLLNACWPLKLETLFMHLTRQRWKRLYGNQYNAEELNLVFRTTPHVSTNHPQNYQKKVVEKYENRISNLINQRIIHETAVH